MYANDFTSPAGFLEVSNRTATTEKESSNSELIQIQLADPTQCTFSASHHPDKIKNILLAHPETNT